MRIINLMADFQTQLPPDLQRWVDDQVRAHHFASPSALVVAAVAALRERGERGGDSALAAAILDSAVDFAVMTLDAAGTITSWSRGAENLLGWSRQAAVGMQGGDIFTPEDRAAGAPSDEMQRARLEGRALDERWHMRADGSRFWGSGLLLPMVEDPSGVARFVKIMRDRTIERENERSFHAMTAAMPGFVWMADADGSNTDSNEHFRSYTGRSAAELNGDRWLEAIHPDDRVETERAWRSAIANGTTFHSRQRFLDAKGEARCYDCRAVPEHDTEGHIVRWVAVCLDAEAEFKARAALERLNLSLEHEATRSSADLASAIEDLQAEMGSRRRAEDAMRQSQKMEAVGQLTGGVAHDFNNLLTVIRSSVDLLRRPELSEDRRRRYLDAIAETADRAAALTGQLLAFARRQPLQPVIFDVARQIEQGAGILRTTLGSRIELNIDIRCQPCPALADPHQFDTAILNIVVNARDAMKGEGRIDLVVSEARQIPSRRDHPAQEGRFIAVSVSDSGVGIGREEMPNIFEPFYTTKPVGAGTGLGLSQVFGFAKQSGGDVFVESTEGEGTTFTIFLPHAEEQAPAASQPETPHLAAARSGRRVLVVEDNQTVGEFAAQLLQDLGYHTRWVKSGSAALEELQAHRDSFDVVFSDVVMAGMNGLDLAKEIQRRHPSLPVVLTSGYSQVLAEEGSQGFELLRKPYSAEALARVLERVMAP